MGQVGVSEQVWAVTPQDYADNAMLAVNEGFDAIKIDFFDRDEEGKPLNFLQQTGFITPKNLKMVESRIKAVRDAIGDEVDIIMENHSSPDAIGAVQLGRLAEKYGIMAFEEPNTPTVQSSEYIAKYCRVPIANGERLFSRWQYAAYFKQNLIQLAQPDIGNGGGISEVKKVADMAYALMSVYKYMLQAVLLQQMLLFMLKLLSLISLFMNIMYVTVWIRALT